MVEPQPAEAPRALLDCILRRGKWARDAAGSTTPDSDVHAPPTEESGTPSRDEAIRRYALAALDNQVAKVKQAAKGTRNQTLNDAALSLGHLVAAGALPESVVRAMLEEAARACGLAKDDGIASVRATITSGIRAGKTQAADLSKIGRRARRRGPRSPSFAPLNTVVGPLGAMAIGGRVWDRRGHASSMQNLNRQAAEAYQTWRGIAKKDRSDALHEADRLRQFGPQLEQAHRGVYGGDDWRRFIPQPLGLVGAAGWNAEMRGLPRQIDYMRLPEKTDAKEEAGKWTPFAGGIDPSDWRTYLGRKFEPQNYAGQAGLGALWGFLGHEAPVTSPFSPDRTAPRVMPNLRSVTGNPTYQKRWTHLPPWQ